MDTAPRGHDPRDFVPDALSVISFAQPLMNPTVDAPAALADVDIELVPPDIKYEYLERLYNVTAHRTQDYFLEFIGQLVGQYLLAQGYESMFFPTPGIHPRSPHGLTEKEIWQGPSKPWSDMYSPYRYSPGPFSHRHAATRAGLGEFGYNNLVLTPQFGPRQRFNSVVTNAPLAADPLIDRPICLRDACQLCQKACIIQAISLRDDPKVQDYRRVDEVDKDVIFVDTPSHTDPVICNSRRDRIPDSPVRGDCYRICPVPKKRTHLPKRLQAIMAEWEGGR
jgi:epoxyqueuosine reductase QueG